jgi:CAAX prenyl protease-like protein
VLRKTPVELRANRSRSVMPPRSELKKSPVFVRAAPFLAFLLITLIQKNSGGAGDYWLYLAKTVIVGWMLWTFRRQIAEMRWKFSGEAIVVGIGVFLMWIGLVPLLELIGINASWAVRKSATAPVWNPLGFFLSPVLGWLFVMVRIVGSTVVVPPMEEVFYRSFVYRYIAKPDFQTVPIGQFFWLPFIITSVMFGFGHHEWLAGILCGFAYQGLVCWKKRLGDAITAHAITNFLLGLWVVYKNAWHFW